MPAQICHLMFAEEALRSALGSEAEQLLQRHGNLFRFGAQGPDFFYHNQHTKPTGLKYGVAAHREGYGRLTAKLVREVRRLEEKTKAQAGSTASIPAAVEQLKAYTLGFATHAFLDKKTHPFIDYFSGWVDPERPETERYFRCHIFFERILDVLMLRRRRGLDIHQFSFLPLVRCGDRLPYPLVKMLLKALNAAYPRMRFKSRDRQRIENAYTDCMFFYTATDPANPTFREMAYNRDQDEGEFRRRLALFHPYELPADLDFLNESHGPWLHPCRSEWVSKASFPELYEQALAAAIPALGVVAAALKGERDPDQVEAAVGNQSLGSGLDREQDCAPQFSSPLPLPELLDGIYAQLAAARSS